jgi:hypothetical protein
MSLTFYYGAGTDQNNIISYIYLSKFKSISPIGRSASAEVHLAVVGDEEEGEVTTTLTARRETSGTRPTWSAMSIYLLAYYLLLVASLYPLT